MTAAMGEARSLPLPTVGETAATGEAAPASIAGSQLHSRDDVLARLEAGIRELSTSEGWRRWLKVQSRFWKYSMGNALLIAMQRPDATMVAGYRRWRELGRQVRSGEHGIRILAPCRYRTREGEDNGEDNEVVEIVRGFRVAVVFALEQTDGLPLPPMPIAGLSGDIDTGLFEALCGYAAELGYSTVFADFATTPSKCGETNFSTRTVTLRCDLPPSHRVKTMLHELAHISLEHNRCTPGARGVVELEAESVAWICCDAIGITADQYSFAYVASWAGGGDDAIAGIKHSAQRIQRTSRVLLERVGATSGVGGINPSGEA